MATERHQLTNHDIRQMLEMAGLEDMDDGLFAFPITGYDSDGFPFGRLEDADTGEVLHHWCRMLKDGWLVW